MARAVVLLCASFALVGTGCRQQPSHPSSLGSTEEGSSFSETADVSDLLRMIGSEPAYLTHPYVMGPERVRMLADRLAREKDPNKRLSIRWQYALALLNAGQSEESVEAFLKLRQEMEAHSPARFRQNDVLLRLYTATAYLRMAEQQNCLAHRSSDSCLFPFSGEGVHQHRSGGAKAKEQLESVLAVDPKHLGARWLYTIASGTLVGSLGEVSDPWLISEDRFASSTEIGRFPNVAQEWGVDALGLAGGCVVDDFDGDEDLDIMSSSWGIDGSLRIFWNLGGGRFEDGTTVSGLEEINGGLNLIQADYDNDGHVDVFVLRGAWLGKVGRHPNSLLKNQGDGTFRDVTREAGLLSLYPTQTAVWLDYNLDGHLDLFVGNEDRGGEGHPCELFHNNGNGTFSSQASAQGLEVRRYVKGVSSADYDNNGWPDLYLSCLGAPNLLFRNEGGRFTDATLSAGVTEPLDSFPTWFFDFDNDGDEDLFVCGYRTDGIGDLARDYLGLSHEAEKPRLYCNLGDGSFEDVTSAFGLDRLLLGMGGNVGDLNQDGFLDFYLGTGDPELMTLVPNRMFLNQEGKGFADVTTSGGFGHLQKGHGVAFADFDEDGAQDVYIVLGGAVSGDTYYNALFRNPGGNGACLKLKLVGTEANRSAIGARIKVVINGESGEREIHRSLGSGGSFGANPLRVYVGLGEADSIGYVEILWPGKGVPEEFRGFELNRIYQLKEGAGIPVELTVP